MLKWYLQKCECKFPELNKRLMFHAGHTTAHLTYFGAVWVQGHGMYSMMGGALLVFGIVGVILKEDVK